MPLIDCSKEMAAYHQEEVALPKSDQDEMRSRRDAGRKRLRAGLAKDSKPEPSQTVSQGSYAMRTMVQDPENDYDIDDGIYFLAKDLVENSIPLNARQARTRVWQALQHDERLK